MAQNPNIDDSTRERAMKFAADKSALAPAKPRIVGKKELEDSGLSLRDFLNKERGLTRRGSDEASGQNKVKAQNEKILADTGMTPAEYVRSGKSKIDKQDEDEATGARNMSAYKPRGTSALSDVIRPGTNTNYENKDVSDMGMKRGGKVKKMAEGGSTDTAQDKALIKKAFKQHDAQEHKGGKGTTLKLSSGGSASKRADGIAQRGKTRA